MDRSTALAIYFASAVLGGLLVGVNALPEPIQFGLAVGLGVFALIFRSRVLRAGAWSRVDIAWGAVFVVTFLPIAWVLGHWPFR